MITFTSDTTSRWACRRGDYVVWAKFQGLFSSGKNQYQISDIWELQDGNFVTITDRQVDLPDWFDLHPLEVSDSLVPWMQKRLENGYDPEEPIDGPNLWRVCAGDRIFWVGPSRGCAHSDDGVLEIVDFKENALVYGEPLEFLEGFPVFGGFTEDELSKKGVRLCRAGLSALNTLGPPRIISTEGQWSIG